MLSVDKQPFNKTMEFTMKIRIICLFDLMLFTANLFSQNLKPGIPADQPQTTVPNIETNESGIITNVFLFLFILRETDTYTIYAVVNDPNVDSLKVKKT